MTRIARFSMIWISALVAFGTGISSSSQAEVHEFHQDCTLMSKPGTYPDYAGLPKYSVAQKRYSAVEPKTLEFNVSISPAAVSGAAMLRLACEFHKQFANEAGVDVLIFDNKIAAENLLLLAEDQKHHYELLWHLRGHYVMDRARGVEFVELLVPRVVDGFLTFDKDRTYIIN